MGDNPASRQEDSVGWDGGYQVYWVACSGYQPYYDMRLGKTSESLSLESAGGRED